MGRGSSAGEIIVPGRFWDLTLGYGQRRGMRPVSTPGVGGAVEGQRAQGRWVVRTGAGRRGRKQRNGDTPCVREFKLNLKDEAGRIMERGRMGSRDRKMEQVKYSE